MLTCVDAKPVDPMRMFPVYVPTGNPVGFAVTVIFAGVVALTDEMVSQLPPVFVAALSVTLRGVSPVARMEIIWVAGAEPPDVVVKVRTVGPVKSDCPYNAVVARKQRALEMLLI
jgi:hypothetical protein